MAHSYRFGIEEEYFLADKVTAHSPSKETAEAFHRAAEKSIEAAEHELLLGQVEISTQPGTDLNEALATLRGYRQDLSSLAAEHGLALFAAGSHPLALSDEQHVASTDRYKRLGGELKLIAPRAAVCAMHVHVEVPDADARVELINRLMPFLPLFLALSVSSPFWEGRRSGFQGYRLTAFSQWPRTGLPDWFAAPSDYRRYIDKLKAVGFIEDASFVWSYIRPSVHYPTIEMRICDSCTRTSDAVAIAALYRALVRAVVTRPEINADFGPFERALCGANLWRAQQAGVAATFADSAVNRTISVAEMLDHTLDLVSEDIGTLEMSEWPARLRSIVRDGTSADRQLGVHEDARSEGAEAALRSVVDSLVKQTLADVTR